MRLILLTAAAMTAFAANSVLNRAAMEHGLIGSMDFAALRLLSGAVMLASLASLRGGAAWMRAFRAVNIAALAVYVIGFSLAYVALPAGAGALILFAAVQVTMFGGAVFARDAVPARRWIGWVAALAGLAWMMLPGSGGVAAGPGALMVIAGLGWGIYSLRGGSGGAPLYTTTASFVGAVPLGLVAWLVAGPAPMTAAGLGLAVASGAITSGLGYALWYAILPALGSTRAALCQLTVPVIAVLAGAALLAEPVSLRLVLACAIVLGGVAFGLAPSRKTTTT